MQWNLIKWLKEALVKQTALPDAPPKEEGFIGPGGERLVVDPSTQAFRKELAASLEMLGLKDSQDYDDIPSNMVQWLRNLHKELRDQGVNQQTFSRLMANEFDEARFTHDPKIEPDQQRLLASLLGKGRVRADFELTFDLIKLEAGSPALDSSLAATGQSVVDTSRDEERAAFMRFSQGSRAKDPSRSWESLATEWKEQRELPKPGGKG